jgi:hypothetical protein
MKTLCGLKDGQRVTYGDFCAGTVFAAGADVVVILWDAGELTSYRRADDLSAVKAGGMADRPFTVTGQGDCFTVDVTRRR